MATIALDPRREASRRPSLARAIDRWIYVAMAVLFLVTVLAGFVPSSLRKIGEIQAGTRPPFPMILHVHAVLMGSFLALLLAQTSLVAAGRTDLHRRLGPISLVLVPAIVATGLVLVPQTWGNLDALRAASPELGEQLRLRLDRLTNVLLLQIRVGILFPLFIALALRARRTDPGMHKRMMILATAVPLTAAVSRITWLPTTMPTNPLSLNLAVLLLVSPMFLWDLLRTRRVHRAYVVWLVLYLPTLVATQLLWGTSWWKETAHGLMGVSA